MLLIWSGIMLLAVVLLVPETWMNVAYFPSSFLTLRPDTTPSSSVPKLEE
jgi:hypothetical protein